VRFLSNYQSIAATHTAKTSAATSVIADKTKSAANIATFIKLGHGEKDQTKKQDMQGQDTVKPPCGVSYEGCTVMAKVHGSTWYLLGNFVSRVRGPVVY